MPSPLTSQSYALPASIPIWGIVPNVTIFVPLDPVSVYPAFLHAAVEGHSVVWSVVAFLQSKLGVSEGVHFAK